MPNVSELRKTFSALFGAKPRVFRAPGRVNLIGEHTDYNDGFVMPAAIEFSTWVAIAPRADGRLVVRSQNFGEVREFSLDDPHPRPAGDWSDYPRGVAVTLAKAGYLLSSASILIDGCVPLGAGLSSSAAIEVAVALALLANSGLEMDRVEMALACQRAENEFVGTRCGIMDQFISCCGREGHALLLDCRSREYRLLPIPSGVKLVICNTMVKHNLAAGEYNARRAECEAGVRHLARALPQVRALRDATLEDLERYGRDLPDAIFRRCRHVISENARTTEGAEALVRADLQTFGRLMAESHRSLRDDYEVSCSELDVMVELAGRAEGVYGARMTGGGFGGCTVNLVSADRAEVFRREVGAGYEKATGRKPEIYVCSAAEGAEEVKEN